MVTLLHGPAYSWSVETPLLSLCVLCIVYILLHALCTVYIDVLWFHFFYLSTVGRFCPRNMKSSWCGLNGPSGSADSNSLCLLRGSMSSQRRGKSMLCCTSWGTTPVTYSNHLDYRTRTRKSTKRSKRSSIRTLLIEKSLRAARENKRKAKVSGQLHYLTIFAGGTLRLW